jgi:DNA-binding response OmpR family regulator
MASAVVGVCLLTQIPEIWRRACGEKIAVANDLDRAGDVDRQRRVVIIAGKPRRLTPEHWQVFTLLYGLRGNVVYSDRIHAELYYGLPERPRSKIILEHVSRLRKVLVRSRYRIINHRGGGYELIIAETQDAPQTEPPRSGSAG